MHRDPVRMTVWDVIGNLLFLVGLGLHIWVVVMLTLPNDISFEQKYLEIRPDMTRSAGLDSIAAGRVRYIQNRHVFSHHGAVLPECILGGVACGKAAVIYLMDSPPHRSAMVDPKYTKFGIAEGWFVGVFGMDGPYSWEQFPGKPGVGKLYVLVLAGNSE
jgi:hypothetical protein